MNLVMESGKGFWMASVLDAARTCGDSCLGK